MDNSVKLVGSSGRDLRFTQDRSSSFLRPESEPKDEGREIIFERDNFKCSNLDKFPIQLGPGVCRR